MPSAGLWTEDWSECGRSACFWSREGVNSREMLFLVCVSFILFKKKVFIMRVVRNWNNLVEVVDAPSLEAFKMDGALSNLV